MSEEFNKRNLKKNGLKSVNISSWTSSYACVVITRQTNDTKQNNEQNGSTSLHT